MRPDLLVEVQSAPRRLRGAHLRGLPDAPPLEARSTSRCEERVVDGDEKRCIPQSSGKPVRFVQCGLGDLRGNVANQGQWRLGRLGSAARMPTSTPCPSGRRARALPNFSLASRRKSARPRPMGIALRREKANLIAHVLAQATWRLTGRRTCRLFVLCGWAGTALAFIVAVFLRL
jgi:hypothetical protein